MKNKFFLLNSFVICLLLLSKNIYANNKISSYIDVEERVKLLNKDNIRDLFIFKKAGKEPGAFPLLNPIAEKLDMPSRYMDNSQEKLNPKYLAIKKVFDDYLEGLSSYSEHYLVHQDIKSAEVVLDNLYKWAEAKSMENPVTQQGHFAQIFYSPTISTALDIITQDGKLIDRNSENKNKIEKIKDWLYNIVKNNLDKIKIEGNNNIYQWQAFSSLLVGNLKEDADLINTSIEKYKKHFEDIGVNNSFKSEDKRNELGLWYNQFALIPDIKIAETLVKSDSNGSAENPYFISNKEGQTLHDVAGFVMDAYDTPSIQGRLTEGDTKYVQAFEFPDAERSQVNIVGGRYLSSWLEIYNYRFPTPRFDDLLRGGSGRPDFSEDNFGFANTAALNGDLEIPNAEKSFRAENGPRGQDRNYFGLTIKSNASGQKINEDFSFADKKITDTGVVIKEIGQDMNQERASVKDVGIDYLIIAKKFNANDDFFSNKDKLNVNQFIGIGFDGNENSKSDGDDGEVFVKKNQKINTWNTFLGYGYGTKGNLSLDGDGAEWDSSGDLKVASSGEGNLVISNAAKVTDTDAYVGFGSKGVGSILIKGMSSLLENKRSLTIGNFGEGSVTVTDQATLSVGDSRWGIRIAPFPGSKGDLNVGSKHGEQPSAPGFINAPFVQLGAASEEHKNRSFGEGKATINFNHDMTNYVFKPKIIGNGHVNQEGLGETILSNPENTFSGLTTISAGTLKAGAMGSLSPNSDYSIYSDKPIPASNKETRLSTVHLDGYSNTLKSLNSNKGMIILSENKNNTAYQPTTLTVAGNYHGDDSHLVLRTVLGNDSSLTDQFIVKGDTSGDTFVAINNAGGKGDKTTNGIQIIKVAGNSNGTFTKEGRIVAGAYDYDIVKKDKDFYLTSSLSPNPMPPVPPGPNPVPPRPVPPVPPKPEPSPKQLRPESASYIANNIAANTLFSLRLHDRVGETQYIDALTGKPEVTSMWLRYAGNFGRFTDASGQLDTKTRNSIVQFGGDIAQWSSDDQNRFHLGLMGSEGHHSNRTSSNLNKYGSNSSLGGYGAGLYGTWYQNDQDKSGLYVDAWTMYNKFKNKVSGDILPTEKYDSRGFVSSIESGYSFLLKNANEQPSFWLQPKAQIAWMGVKAKNHTEANGTNVHDNTGMNTQTRLGLRAYLQNNSQSANDSALQMFVEGNWIHNDKAYSVKMDDVSNSVIGAKNIAELKFGIEAKVTKNFQVWSNVSHQMGKQNYKTTVGTVGIKYSF